MMISGRKEESFRTFGERRGLFPVGEAACFSYQPPQSMGFRIQDYAVRKTYQQDFELALPGKAR